MKIEVINSGSPLEHFCIERINEIIDIRNMETESINIDLTYIELRILQNVINEFVKEYDERRCRWNIKLIPKLVTDKSKFSESIKFLQRAVYN